MQPARLRRRRTVAKRPCLRPVSYAPIRGDDSDAGMMDDSFQPVLTELTLSAMPFEIIDKIFSYLSYDEFVTARLAFPTEWRTAMNHIHFWGKYLPLDPEDKQTFFDEYNKGLNHLLAELNNKDGRHMSTDPIHREANKLGDLVTNLGRSYLHQINRGQPGLFEEFWIPTFFMGNKGSSYNINNMIAPHYAMRLLKYYSRLDSQSIQMLAAVGEATQDMLIRHLATFPVIFELNQLLKSLLPFDDASITKVKALIHQFEWQGKIPESKYFGLGVLEFSIDLFIEFLANFEPEDIGKVSSIKKFFTPKMALLECYSITKELIRIDSNEIKWLQKQLRGHMPAVFCRGVDRSAVMAALLRHEKEKIPVIIKFMDKNYTFKGDQLAQVALVDSFNMLTREQIVRITENYDQLLPPPPYNKPPPLRIVHIRDMTFLPALIVQLGRLDPIKLQDLIDQTPRIFTGKLLGMDDWVKMVRNFADSGMTLVEFLAHNSAVTQMPLQSVAPSRLPSIISASVPLHQVVPTLPLAAYVLPPQPIGQVPLLSTTQDEAWFALPMPEDPFLEDNYSFLNQNENDPRFFRN